MTTAQVKAARRRLKNDKRYRSQVVKDKYGRPDKGLTIKGRKPK